MITEIFDGSSLVEAFKRAVKTIEPISEPKKAKPAPKKDKVKEILDDPKVKKILEQLDKALRENPDLLKIINPRLYLYNS